MYDLATETFNSAIEQNGGRTFHAKLECSDYSIESGIKKISFYGGSSGEQGITIGSAVSSYIEVVLEKTDSLITGQEFSFDLGLETSLDMEYMPMGKFVAKKPTSDDFTTTFKAYDRMAQTEKNYASALTYPTDTVSVMNEISEILGYEFVTDIEAITLNNPSTEQNASNAVFAGYTIREAIGYIAGLYGKFAIFNRLGQLEFKWYEDNGFEVSVSKCYAFTRNEDDYSVERIVGVVSDETKYEAGSGTMGISYSNPFLTQNIVDNIYSSVGNFTYRGSSTTFLGDCRIDVWDIVTGYDLYGNSYKIPVMEIIHEIDGGLTTTVSAYATEDEDISDIFKGPTTKAIERTHAELLLVNKLLATKITAEEVEANYVQTKELDAIKADIESAVIENLEADFITAEQADLRYATIENLNSSNARIETLEANALTAESAVIKTLQGGVADINTLIFGSASGTTIQTEFANSVIAVLGDAQITSAMIKEMSADKITSGSIKTNNVEIVSDDGNLVISDETIQISDGSIVRVQIGKDASEDYSINIWDADGKLMFSQGGITENAIKEAIIRDDMVSDTANISATKLNISSLFSVINNDKSHTLSSSKIYVDADKQTLDVSFERMNTKMDEFSTEITSQGTQLGVVQGQIASKIWQEDIDASIDKVSVGARNLLIGSKDFSDDYTYFSDYVSYADENRYILLDELGNELIAEEVF